MKFKLTVDIPDDFDTYYNLQDVLATTIEDLRLIIQWPPTADVKHHGVYEAFDDRINYKWGIKLND